MCNLYAMLASQDSTRRHFAVDPARDYLGNAEPLPAIWPKYEAPILRLGEDGTRELVSAHWGFLTPKVSAKTGKALKPDAWNNARDDKLASSGLWKDSFLNRRCLVPGTSFREAKGRNPAEDFWFALIGDEERPLFAFAGLWRRGQPGIEGEEGGWITHTMVTTTPNKLVEPVHPTRMPVILDPQDYETWLYGTPAEAAELLRPFPAEKMRVVRQGSGLLVDKGEE